ncbi:MAG: hypothetical protein ACNFW9_02630 [Candidatus Kerfeldbacteria bacterium]
MNNEILILFGGFILLLSLKRKQIRSRRRIKGSIKMVVLMVEGFILLTGISTLMIGLISRLK